MAASAPPLLGSYLGVAEVSTTSGSGAFALLGAIANSLPFSAKVPDGATITVKVDGGAQIEFLVAIYTYPSTITPVSVISSTNGDQKIEWPATGQRIISLEQNFPEADAPCPFPDGGVCAQALIKTGPNCYDNEWQWRPYPIAAWVSGAPDADQRIRLAVTEPLRIDAGFAGSYGYCDTAPAADFVIVINVVFPSGAISQLGTVTFPAGTKVSTWASTGDVDQYLSSGDRLEYLFPTDPDSIADITLTTRAVIVCQDTVGAVQFIGGGFGTTGLIEFALPTATEPADTILLACWLGYADTRPGSNLVLVFANSGASYIGISIGDGVGDIASGHFGVFLSIFDGVAGLLSGYIDIPVDLTDGWHSLAISLQASTSTLQILCDGTVYDDATNITWDTWTGANRFGDHLTGQWQFGGGFADGTGSNVPPAFTFTDPLDFTYTGFAPTISVYQFRIGFDEAFFDLADSGNVALLFGSGRTYTNWGSSGELVTGTSPPGFFKLDARWTGTNYGTSGSVSPRADWTDGGAALVEGDVLGFVPLPPGAT